MFDENYIDALSDNPLDAGRVLCSDFLKFHDDRLQYNQDLSGSEYDTYLAAFGAAQALCESNGLKLDVPKILQDRNDCAKKIWLYINSLQGLLDLEFASLTVGKSREKLKIKFGKTFHYEFSVGDVSRAQELINEIRNLVTGSELFEENHRARLLARLEKLQSELHKKMSDLDSFWGLIGDAGVVLGKFGNDAKPFLDRIRELTFIVWATQSRNEGLPSNCPPPLSLPSPSPEASPHPHDSEPSSIDV